MSIVTELKYTANLDKGVCMTPITPSFMGGDQEAHRIAIDCYRQNSREPVDLSSAGVTAYFVRADGMTIPLVGETNGSKASVLLPAACYAVMGRFSLVIKLSLGDSINTVFWGEGAVSRSRTDVVIDPDSVIPSIEELLAKIAAMEIATNNANAAADNANQAAANALNNVDEAVARQDETISQLSEEIGVIANCSTDHASREYVTCWTSGRIESGNHVNSTGYAYSDLIDYAGEPVEYFFDTSYIKRMMIIYCDETGSVAGYASWKTESPVTCETSRPKYRLQVNLLANDRFDDLPTGVYREKAAEMSLIVEKVLSLEKKTATVYVDGETGSDDNNGTKEAPYATIQKGIDSGAKIVYVATGEYSGNISVSRSDDITIMPTTYSSTYIDSVEDTPKIVMNGQVAATDSGNVTVIGVHCRNHTSHGFYINRVKNIKLVDCIASDCTGEGVCGYKILSSNGKFIRCVARNVPFDGFNMHGYGHTDFIDCSAYDCRDDGISHHDGCSGSIVGGEWYRCGKGGVSSPTYGAYVDVRNVYSHDNKYGLYSSNDSAHRQSKGLVSNCVFKGNQVSDIYINNSIVTAWNVIYDTKNITASAEFTEFPAAQ